MTKQYLDEQGAKIIIDTLRKEMEQMQEIIDNNTKILKEFEEEELILYGGSASEIISGGSE